MDLSKLINRINLQREQEKPLSFKSPVEVIDTSKKEMDRLKAATLLPIEAEISKLTIRELNDQWSVHQSWLETHAPSNVAGKDINGRDLDILFYRQIEKRKTEIVVDYFSRPLGEELEIVASEYV